MAALLLAERFGKWPWELDEQPTDKVLHYMAIMGVQGEARTAMDGLKPDEPFYRLGD